MSTDDLAAWLVPILKEEERAARSLAAAAHPHHRHIIRHARIAADLQILAEYVARDDDADLMLGPDCQRQREWSGLRLAIHFLASAYAGRPGYREEWRP